MNIDEFKKLIVKYDELETGCKAYEEQTLRESEKVKSGAAVMDNSVLPKYADQIREIPRLEREGYEDSKKDLLDIHEKIKLAYNEQTSDKPLFHTALLDSNNDSLMSLTSTRPRSKLR